MYCVLWTSLGVSLVLQYLVMMVITMVILVRLDICQKLYTTQFLGKQFYTLKVQNFGLFLLKKKQHKCIDISNLSDFLLKFN